jgi:hypothetical protein
MNSENPNILNLDFTCTLHELCHICDNYNMHILETRYINGNLNAKIEIHEFSNISDFNKWYNS